MKYFTFLGLSLFFFANMVFAQESGVIMGNVNDIVTKTVLQEAQIYIEGEYLGDVSDYAGNYEIRNVKPGVYTVEALLIGYEKVTKKNIRVVAGETTTINFSLSPTIYESEGRVVVTATKMEKEIKDIPASVYLVSMDDIKQAEMRNVETMLQKIPGVFTEDRFHSEYNVVSFRGVGLHSHVTRGILVLVDGISINEAMGRVDFEGIDLGNIEKIEVLKGPVSALYGPNGITGVINIVTKKAPEKFESKIESSFGAYDLRKFTMSAGGKLGQYGVYLSASDHSTNGYRDRNSYNADKFAAKLQADYERFGNMMLSLDYIQSDTDFPGPLSKDEFETRTIESSSKFAGSKKEMFRMGITHKKHFESGFDLNTNLFFRNSKNEGGYNDTFTSEDDINLFGGEIRLQRSFFILGKRNSIIGGITAERENGDSETFDLDEFGVKTDMTDKGTSIYEINGYYLQNDFQISDRKSV
ncbi:MAG: TonB-dependent receptor, partial [Calditrichaceae bacterium]